MELNIDDIKLLEDKELSNSISFTTAIVSSIIDPIYYISICPLVAGSIPLSGLELGDSLILRSYSPSGLAANMNVRSTYISGSSYQEQADLTFKSNINRHKESIILLLLFIVYEYLFK